MTTAMNFLATRAAEIDRLLNHCYPRPSADQLDEIKRLYTERREIQERLSAIATVSQAACDALLN